MSKAQDFTAPQDVQEPRRPDPAPLAPEECEADWKECLDAGQDRGPTSMHRERGWRAIPTVKP